MRIFYILKELED